jgi:hypothetical protein
VKRGRIWSSERKALPASIVYLPTETIRQEGGLRPGIRRSERRSTLRVVGAFAAPVIDGTDFEDEVDAYVEQVEARFAGDPTLGGIARSVSLRAVTTGFDGSGSGDVIVVAIDFEVIVDHREGVPGASFTRSRS